VKLTLTIFLGPARLDYRNCTVLEARDGYVKLKTKEGSFVTANGFPYLIYEEPEASSILGLN
jgi:hypothetical protein